MSLRAKLPRCPACSARLEQSPNGRERGSMADMTEERQSCKKRVTSVSRLSLSVHWTQSRRSKAKLSKPTETSAVEPPPRKTLPYFKTLKMRLDSGEYDYRRSDVCSAERPKSKLPSREFSAKRLAEKCRHPLDASCYTTNGRTQTRGEHPLRPWRAQDRKGRERGELPSRRAAVWQLHAVVHAAQLGGSGTSQRRL